jgi:REP element-mobilizing transposase RayT
MIFSFYDMDVPRFRDRFRVPSARRRGWDYRWAGVYAVTVCVHGRICCLGEVVEDDIAVTGYGEIVASEWQRIPEVHPHVTLDEWIIMPDHLHGILIFQSPGPAPEESPPLPAGSLGIMVGQFKMRSTKRIRTLRNAGFNWQERFYDQILCDPNAVEKYRRYIRENPLRWALNRKPNRLLSRRSPPLPPVETLQSDGTPPSSTTIAGASPQVPPPRPL